MSVGIYMVEWSWKKLKRVKEVVEERDSMYPAFRRTDAMHWSKYSFYPMAVTLLPMRFFIGVMILLSSALYGKAVLYIDDESKPLSGWQWCLIRPYYWWCSNAIVWLNFIKTKTMYVNTDYSEWLGPDYRNEVMPK
jgi:hypothetical protein